MKRTAGSRENSFTEAIYKHQEVLQRDHLLCDFAGLNQVLGNGFEPGLFHLIYGSSHIIRSILLSMAVVAQLPRERGLNSAVIFIDNDNIFNPYTLIRLARSVKLNPNMVLSRILVARAFIWNHLGEIVRNLEGILEETRARLVLISGLTTLFEGAYDRKKSHALLKITNTLKNIAVDKEILVVASAHLAKGSKEKPAGGKIIAHIPHILLRVMQQKEQIMFKLIKHPSRPAMETKQWLSYPHTNPYVRPLEYYLKSSRRGG